MLIQLELFQYAVKMSCWVLPVYLSSLVCLVVWRPHREVVLGDVGDQHMWLLYISYLTAKGLHRPAVGQHLNASIAVVRYLQQQHQGHDI